MRSGDSPPSAPSGAAATADALAVDLGVVRSGVRLMALRRLGDTALADEVAQETLTRALRALDEKRLADPARLGAFVRGIARHVIADVLRERGRARTTPIADNLPSRAPDSLEILVTAEERARVRAALQELGEGDREILRLCFFEGMSPAELAQRLGEPSARIRKRKSRALDRLRAAFLGGPAPEVVPSPAAIDRSDPGLALGEASR